MKIEFNPMKDEFLYGTPDNGFGVYKEQKLHSYAFTVVVNGGIRCIEAIGETTIEGTLKKAMEMYIRCGGVIHD